MGPSRLKLWFKRWSAFDSAKSLAEIIWIGATTAFGVTGAAVIAWGTSTLDWYWASFQWLGVAMAFLIAWLSLSLGFFLFAHGVRAWQGRADIAPQSKSVAELGSPNTGASQSVQSLPPQTTPVETGSSGFIAKGTGTVGEPPLYDSMGLYVGQMIVGTAALAERRVLEIAIRAFNGTGRTVTVRRVEGALEADITKDGVNTPIGALPPPWLDERTITKFRHGHEFTIALEQRVTGEIADALASGEEYQINLVCQRLNIIVGAIGDGEAVRLPLWDGMTLAGRPFLAVTGRMAISQGRSISAHVAESLNVKTSS